MWISPLPMTSLARHPESAQPPTSKKPDLGALAVILAAGLLLWGLAYQAPLRATLSIGGNTQTHRRDDDSPFLHGFNASEPFDKQHWQWWELSPGYGYRWTTGNASVELPGVGGGDWVVSLSATSGRPEQAPTRSTWQIGERVTQPLTIPAGLRTYHFLTEADMGGNLHIQMQTPLYASNNDPRDLGFVLHEVRIAPTKQAVRVPALPHIGWLALALVSLFLLSRWLTLGRRAALLAGLAGGGVLAALLVCCRLALTVFAPTLAAMALVCWPLSLLLQGAVWATGVETRRANPMIGLVVLAFALRLGGMLHPHAIFNDHVLNANNLLQVERGEIFFTEGLPAEAGGGQAPYPPGSYLLAAPTQLLAPTSTESRVVMIQSSVALLDSLCVALLWWMLWQAGLGQRAALMGAALYLLPAPHMTSFSIGEYANIGGQAMALPFLALLAWHRANQHQGASSIRYPAVLVLALGMGLLGHMGVSISLLLLLLALWGFRALAVVYHRLRSPGNAAAQQRAHAVLIRLTWTSVLATIGVAVCYYSTPLFVPILAGRLAGQAGGGTGHTTPLLERLAGVGVGMLPIYSHLSPLLAGCGLLGGMLLWQHSRHSRCSSREVPVRELNVVVAAWLAGTLLSFGLLLVANQGVRWSHFLYPALCLGAGPLLAATWRRGAAGRLIAGVGVSSPIIYGLIVWVSQLRDYWH